MKMKTNELTGVALDWVVARIEFPHWWDDIDHAELNDPEGIRMDSDGNPWWRPSTDWDQGGPIMGREEIAITYGGEKAHVTACLRRNDQHYFGHHHNSPLIAAMRCFAASRLGAEVEVPDAIAEAA